MWAEMTFTDDDLKWIKSELAANRRMEWPMPDCEALLARLEAAERCLDNGANDNLLIKAWRKAAGR